MNIKDYISSGILEHYVLGLISESDRKELEQYMLQYPEIKREVHSIEKAMELFAEGSQMKPSDGLEAKILKEIENTPRDLAIKEVPKPTTNWWPYLLGLLLIGAAILSWYFYSQNQQAQQELEDQRETFRVLQENCDQKDEDIQQLNDQLEIMISTANKKYSLNQGDKALAAVMYNSESQKAYFNTGDLPTAPTDRKYELWALVDGVPVSMGQFDVINGDSTFIEVPFIENAGVFAVTLEPLDNDPAPNLDELQAISS